uniref:Ribosomal protein S14 n=1 Tax=Romanomermis culicivorax TaxID=13658 RepID=A0A915IX02_ROMCU
MKEKRNTYKEKYKVKKENLKKVLLHSPSLVRNRPIRNSVIWEFAQLGIAHIGIAQLKIRPFRNSLNWESLNGEFAHLGIAHMRIPRIR